MRTGAEYAEQAKLSKYDKIKYDQYDCQAFCELVLKDMGIRQPNGGVYNWKGSNDMFRNACSWVGTIAECKAKYGDIPLGAWAFMWDNTGAEERRGYYDGKGNASHVGIYIGSNSVRDSTKIKTASGTITRDGVGIRSLNSFQRIGLPAMLAFPGTSDIIKLEINREEASNIYSRLQDITKIVEGWLK